MKIEQKLAELGLVLPEAFTPPAGMEIPFLWLRVRGNRAYIAGHVAQQADGSVAGPFGKVGADVTVEEAYGSARLVALSILGNLKRELGDLDRVSAWLRVLGFVNAAPGFNRTTAVVNGFSDLIVDLYGPNVGRHARAAVGVAELPFNVPVEVEAEVEIDANHAVLI